jgi:predicted secreted protein
VVEAESGGADTSEDADDATDKLSWRARISVWIRLWILAEVIFMTIGVLFRLPSAAMVTGAVALLVGAVTTFVAVHKDWIHSLNFGSDFARKVGPTFTLVVVVACAVVIGAVLFGRSDNHEQPPLIKTSMVALPLDGNTPPDTTDGRSWTLVVPDPSRIRSDLPSGYSTSPTPGTGCADLWRMAVDAGGQEPTTATFKVQIWGDARVTIVDMRARLRGRFPASDGALVECHRSSLVRRCPTSLCHVT